MREEGRRPDAKKRLERAQAQAGSRKRIEQLTGAIAPPQGRASRNVHLSRRRPCGWPVAHTSAMKSSGRGEVYISVDVEADGPVPGPYSLVSLGACVAAFRTADGRVDIIDPDQHTFYSELKPISETWNYDALAVSGLTREHLAENGAEPSVAITEFVGWVDEIAARFKAKPVFAAYPLGFDWQFAYYYMLVYAGRSPFGHSAHFDMKTAYAVHAHVGVREATKRNMPLALLGSRKHTHNALDDAKGQADLLAGLFGLITAAASIEPHRSG
jgi:hypothetical protein